MKTYVTRAVRWQSEVGHGWELHVDGVGVTQVDDLEEAPDQVRDFVETITGASAAGDRVQVLIEDQVR